MSRLDISTAASSPSRGYYALDNFRDGLPLGRYATVSMTTADSYGGVGNWFLQNASTPHLQETDDVYLNGSLIRESFSSLTQKESARNVELAYLQQQAEEKIRWNIEQSEGFASMTQSGTVSFAPGVTRNDLIGVTQSKIGVLHDTVESIQNSFTNQAKTIMETPLSLSSKEKTGVSGAIMSMVVIIIAVFAALYMMTRRK
jgi:hypothetical protein